MEFSLSSNVVGVASLLELEFSFVKKGAAGTAGRRREEEVRDTDSPAIAASRTVEGIK